MPARPRSARRVAYVSSDPRWRGPILGGRALKAGVCIAIWRRPRTGPCTGRFANPFPQSRAENTPMDKQTLSFQAEVKQILHLVTHSLYSNKEIFLRELISNASDACDKLRFEATLKPELYEGKADLEVRVAFDKDAKTITITDNGIGLSAAEAVANLGTIAKSGTREFMSALEGDQKKDAQLIGQFGVGFYSGFIVADRITVDSRRAGLKPEEGVRWTSDGAGDFEVETID